MFCRKCGTEIDMQYRNPDGTVECSKCGAVYMLRSNTTFQSRSRQPQSTRREPPARSSATRPLTTPHRRHCTAKPGIPKWFLGIVAVCLVAVVISIITATSNPYSEQYKVIAKMEKAFNDRDLKALFACFEPSVSESFLAMAEMMDLDFDTIISELGFMAAGTSGYDSDLLRSVRIKLTPVSCIVNGDEATVTVQMRYTASKGTSDPEETTMDLTKVDGAWYLAD